jgi:SAM-dependent methyltransferase
MPDSREIRRLVGRAGDVVRGQGLVPVVRETRFVAGSYLGFPLRHQLGVRDGTFTLGGRRLPYYRGLYAGSWRTERTVEVPVALDVAASAGGGRTLEIGNVLANYGLSGHDVVDKYEVAPGVANEDVVDLDRPGAYDLVISVSTLEHVGFDETPPDPGKLRRALEVLRTCLAPGGTLFVTLPLGYNPSVDDGIREDALGFEQAQFLRRVSRANEWVEVDGATARGERYDAPFPKANAVFLGTHRAAT